MRKTFFLLSIFVLTLGFFLWSCEEAKNPVEVVPQEATPLSKVSSAQTQSVVLPQADTLASFIVHYNGRTFDGTFTTFSYTATGPGVDLHVRLELPSCAPASFTANPTNGVTSNNDNTFNINPGIEWHPSTGSAPADTFNFSITYLGNVREGIVQVGIKTPAATEVGLIAGACARVFDISGTVFTDADENGIRGASETGIGDVKVRLKSGGTAIDSVITNSTGNYIFEAFPEGTYVVEVDTNSVAATSTKYLAATTSTSKTVTVGPNSTGNDFGFAPRRSQLINDLKFGVLQTFGESAGYWKKQLQVAVSGKGTAEVPADSLTVYVARIRALLLPDPFTLPGGNGLQAALDLLSRPVKTDLDKLVRELLASEFNFVSGRGVTTGTTPDPDLHLFLLGWGEALVNSLGGITPFAAGTASSTEDAITIFTQLNSSGGGSGSK